MYDEKRLASHLEDVKRALKESNSVFDEQEMKQEFEKYLYTYQIPLQEAKRSIVRKYKGDPDKLSFGVDKALSDLRINEPGVNILCRMITVNPKTVEFDGKRKEIYYGILGDNVTTLPYSSWSDFKLKKGDVLHITNVSVKEWNGKPQINIHSSSVITRRETTELPQPSFSIEGHKLEVKDLQDKIGNISIVFRVLSIEEKVISKNEERKTVQSGIAADHTGQVRFSYWSEQPLRAGEVLRVGGAYTKDYNGIPQLVFDDRSSIERLPDETQPTAEELNRPVNYSIWNLFKRGGGVNVSVKGVVLDVKAGSGLIFRCPACARALKKGACMLHGPQEGVADLRVKGVLDDGTSACSVIMGKDITEGILKMSLDEALGLARSKMNFEVVRDRLLEMLIARSVTVSGDAFFDEFGLHLNAKEMRFWSSDLNTKAQALLDELGVV